MATNYNHIAYAYNSDGNDKFSNGYPVLNLVSETNKIKEVSGVNSNPTDIYYSLLYYFEGKQLEQFGLEAGDVITTSYDWEVKGSNISGEFFIRLSQNPWTALGSTGIIKIDENNKSGHQVHSLKVTQAMLDGKAQGTQLRQNSVPTTVTITIRNFKIEKNNEETSWMPSLSEVTSQDYPTYIGTYTDESENSSTDPADYTWEMMNYRIYLDGVAVAGSKLLSAKVENLKPDTSYTIQVKQVSGEEESDFSDSVTFKTNVQK
jgi:hypothetical protein